jgi:hypothetical protein
MTSTVQQAIDGDISVSYTEGSTVSWTTNEASSSWFTTTNVGRLALSMQYPGKPFSIGQMVFCILICGFIGDLVYVFDNLMKDMPDTLFVNQIFLFVIFCVMAMPFGILPGIGYGLLLTAVLYLFTIPNRMAWNNKRRLLLTSKYCYRDNVIFRDGKASRPQSFIQDLFGK